jgi:catechol 2,3-dioxygenase-like lactoylglutathione lyase family enzyme
VNACVPVVYVADIAASVAFYEHLGLTVQADGQESGWRYSYLKCGDVGVLLAAGGTAWSTDPGPVHLYFAAMTWPGWRTRCGRPVSPPSTWATPTTRPVVN